MLKILAWCLSFLLCCWSLPAFADTRIPVNARLEQQILQVLRDHPEAIIESVQAYQQQQQEQQFKNQQAILEQMKANPVAIAATSPIKGSPEFKTVIFEFSDFQCNFCAQAYKTLQAFVSEHPNDVTLVYKHLPLAALHPQALPAARATWAAAQQGKFWEFHNALFDHQDQLGEELYHQTAKQLKLDLDQFESDRNRADSSINQDIELAYNLGVSGTPFFVFNGEPLPGVVEKSELESRLAAISPTPQAQNPQ